MVFWFNYEYIDWINRGCPVTDELNDVTQLTIFQDTCDLTINIINKRSLFRHTEKTGIFWE